MIVGDKRKYLTCLMTLKVYSVMYARALRTKHSMLFQCDMDPNTGEPLDTLAPLAKLTIEQLGSRCTTVSGIIDSKDRAVFSAITEGLERANKHAVSNAQKVCYFVHSVCELYSCDACAFSCLE